MKTGIRAHDVSAAGLEEACGICREKGIEYIQLVLEKSIEGFSCGKYSEEYAKALSLKLNGTKLAILGSYINPANSNDEQLFNDTAKFKEKIKYASILKPIAVGTETGIYKEGEIDSEESYLRVLSTLRELTKEAEKYGVNIGIEGVKCFVINSPEKMKRLTDDLDSDNVKVIFDPVNLLDIENYKEQDKIIEDVFELLSDKICVVHLKDFIIEEGKMKRVIPGFGILNYKLIFEKMREKNIDVPMICEEINSDEALTAFEKLKKIR